MYWFSKKRIIAIMVLPTLLLYLCYIIFPLLVAFYYSFTNFSGIGTPAFVGLKNFQTLFKDKFFFIALKNSFIVFLMSILLLVPLSFFLALLLNRGFRGNMLVKAMCFSPNIIAPILVGLMWVFILDPSIGLINSLLRAIGLDALTNDWIGGKTLTPYSVAIVYLWQKLGFQATVFLAGLKMVPQELYEAGEIDGAGRWQKMVYITLPMIKQTIIINSVLVITSSFKIFELVVQLTNGGPNHFSELLVTYMYYTTFTGTRFGYGMSIAVVAFIISAIFTCFAVIGPNRRVKEAR